MAPATSPGTSGRTIPLLRGRPLKMQIAARSGRYPCSSRGTGGDRFTILGGLGYISCPGPLATLTEPPLGYGPIFGKTRDAPVPFCCVRAVVLNPLESPHVLAPARDGHWP